VLMTSRELLGLALALVTTVAEAETLTFLNYAIDPFSDPASDGFNSATATTPGQPLVLTEPNGKGGSSGSADYGSLQGTAQMALDFQITDNQLQIATAETRFSDTLTITGSNPGAPATAVFRVRVRGFLQQPFFFSEATLSVGAYASLAASRPGFAQFDERNYSPEPPEPNPSRVVDDTIEVTLDFTVGEAIDLSASLLLEIATAITNTGEGLVDPLLDFEGPDQGLELLSIELTGVNSAAISAESGTSYAFTASPAAAVHVPLMSHSALAVLMLGLGGLGWRRLRHRAGSPTIP
jgi:hypothetical protein